MNDFEKYLVLSAIEIKKEIETTLSIWNSVVETQTPALSDLNHAFTESFAGGKYIRGTLVKLGAEIAGIKNKEIIKIAAAFEILHTALLIHDDIIDKSKIRRGKPTLHTLFGNNHYSTSQALCLGDIGLFIANKLIADSALPTHKKNVIISEFSQIVLDTILGEMLDVKTSSENIKKEKDIVIIQKLKTAYYTIVGPLSVGAKLGKISDEKYDAIKTFGEYIGMAYQIQDDILGIFGEEEKLGKSTSSDIEENKNTLLIAYALKKSSPKQKMYLNKYYGVKKITKEQHKKIISIFKDTGSLLYSQEKIKKYILEAKEIIPTITNKKTYQHYLYKFSDFILAREK